MLSCPFLSLYSESGDTYSVSPLLFFLIIGNYFSNPSFSSAASLIERTRISQASASSTSAG